MESIVKLTMFNKNTTIRPQVTNSSLVEAGEILSFFITKIWR